MKKRNYLSSVLFLVIFFSCKKPMYETSDCVLCNIKEVVKTEKKINNIKEVQIRKFLCTIKKECQTNIEFSEYSNKVLFALLDKHMNEVVKVLSDNKSMDMEYILFQVSNPLLDYNIKDLLLKVEKSGGKAEIKIQLINALKKSEGN